MDISIRCFGEYSYRVTNPMLFLHQRLRQRGGRLHPRADRQPAQERAADGAPARVRQDLRNGRPLFGAAGAPAEIAEALNDVLSEKWANLRGVEIVSFGVNRQGQETRR